MFASEASKEAAEELVLPQQTRLQNMSSPVLLLVEVNMLQECKLAFQEVSYGHLPV